MKKIFIIILVLVSFVLGFCLCKIYPKINYNSNKKIELNSGIYKDLYFQSLRKEGDIYYIKFNRQMEDKVFPDYCYQNGNFIENYDNDCVMQGRQMQDKVNPEIDLSKEYKLTKNAEVELITYDSGYLTYVNLGVGTFYEYINNFEKPWANFYSFSVENLQYLSFNVIVLSGEIVNLQEVYKE